MAKNKKEIFEEITLKNIPVNDLIEAEYNPRFMSDEKREEIENSIKKFGLVEPIVVNSFKGRENVVIGGHQRLLICKDLGHTKVPCSIRCLNLPDEKELNIRLNKAQAEFDRAKLNTYFEKKELLGFGFKEFEFHEYKAPDYSILDESEIDNQIQQMSENVKKAIQIEFRQEDYLECYGLVKYWREKGMYIGGFIFDRLKEEKAKNEPE